MKSYASSLFGRNLLLVFVPLAFLLAMGLASTLIAHDYITRQTNAAVVASLTQAQETLELMLNELDSVNLTFSTDPEFVNALTAVVSTPGVTLESWEKLRTIHNFISSAVNARSYLHSMYVYIENPYRRVINTLEWLSVLDEFYDTAWYRRFLDESPDKIVWTERRNVRPYAGWDREEPVIQISRRTSVTGSERNRGLIVLNVNIPAFERLLSRFTLSEAQGIIVLNDRGELMLSTGGASRLHGRLPERVHAGELGVTEIKLDGERYVLAHLSSPRFRWSYVSVAPRSRLYAASYRLRTINVALVALSFAAGLLLTWALSRRSFGSIRRIADAVEAAEAGRPIPHAAAPGRDAYGTIAYNILRTFIEHSYLKVQRRALELQALQAQMNPHFLFNTLETISFRALRLTGKPSQVNRMIENLADILKYSLESPDAPVTLADEIEQARAYLEIQSIRYPRRFRVAWDCDQDLGTVAVIRLVLQPLIENAIYHGIKEKKGQGTITITTRRAGGDLEISVRDDGVGMSEDRLAEVRSRLDQDSPSSGHIGLPNTNRRLRLAYGEPYGVRIEGERQEGTTVTLRIPLGPANPGGQPGESRYSRGERPK